MGVRGVATNETVDWNRKKSEGEAWDWETGRGVWRVWGRARVGVKAVAVREEVGIEEGIRAGIVRS